MRIKAMWDIYDEDGSYLMATSGQRITPHSLGKISYEFSYRSGFNPDLASSIWVLNDLSLNKGVDVTKFDPPIPTAVAQMLVVEQLYARGFDVEVVE